MAHNPKFEIAIDLCWDAINDDRLWPAAMDSVAQAFDARGSSLHTMSPRNRLELPASAEYTAFLHDFVGNGWAAIDHRAKMGWSLLKGGGKVVLDDHLLPLEDLQCMPVYHELYQPHDMIWWAAISFVTGNELWAVSLLKSRQAGPFCVKDIKPLLQLAPHFSRILRLKKQFELSRARDAVAMLNASQVAALILDDTGKIVASNSNFEVLLGSELSIRSSRLVVASSTANSKLQKMVHAALAGDHAAPVVIDRYGRQSVAIDGVRCNMLANDYPKAHVLLTATDPETETRAPPQRLQQMFSLTPAEARLACHLMVGEPLKVAAASFGTSYETSRAQLKSIFNKTGTNRQADLIALLLGSKPLRLK